MKFNDAVWGAVLVVFAGLLHLHVRGFPAIPGQQVGPNALPEALALGLGVCGVLLFWRGLRSLSAGARWVELPAWFGSPPQVLGFAVLVAVNALYLLGAERLGFILVGVVYLAALMMVLRVRPLRAVWVAVLMTLLIHYVFYKLLRVPLPWGMLQRVAW